MNQLFKYALLAGLFFLVFLPAQAQKGISYWQVRKDVKELSSDEMRGRKAGTEGAKMAAQYISNHFEEIGLSPIPGEYSFYQEFELHELETDSVSLQVNEFSIPSDEYFMVSSRQKVRWKEQEGLSYVHIGKEEEFGKRFRELQEDKEDRLVTVDPSHLELFERYRNYFGRSFKTLKLQEDGAVQVFMLSNEISANEINFYARRAVKSIQMANVAGMIKGKSRPQEYVIFSSHYDHLGVLEAEEGDSIANGADDNASGTAAVMALAKHYQKIGGAERSLIFIAFTAEEMGGYGSKYFSGQLNAEKITAMFNIEMIGTRSKFGKRTAYITGYEKSNFGSLLQEELEDSRVTFFPDPYPDMNLFMRSDNASLALLGVPAHTITTARFDFNEYYHTVHDEFRILDLRNMSRIIKALADGSKGIVNARQTPERLGH